MPKTSLVTKWGTKITIEGTSNDVAALIKRLEGEPEDRSVTKSSTKAPRRGSQKRQKQTPINLISSLIDGAFFRKPKDLAAVKVALEELGRSYPVTTLSPALLRLVRKRQLKRYKDKKRWLYVQPGK